MTPDLELRRWAAWLVESADQADDLTEAEGQGMRIAATHLVDDEIAARVARIDGLDDEWLQGFTERLNDRIEAHRFAVRTVRAAFDGKDVRLSDPVPGYSDWFRVKAIPEEESS